MAWHVGTEWDPAMVDNTNAKHADVPQYKGVHFSASPEASPFENWLAEPAGSYGGPGEEVWVGTSDDLHQLGNDRCAGSSRRAAV